MLAPDRVLLVITWLVSAQGHAYLSAPQPRNVRPGEEWCPQCGNGAGVCGGKPGGQWGATPVYIDVFDGVRATYTAGQIVDFQVAIKAHHKGHFEFKICDRRINSTTQDPDACLNHWKLHRVPPEESYRDCQANDARGDCQPLDAKHPERWYLPPKVQSTEVHTMKFRIPADLQCTECTLQWRWWTANSCVPAEDYGCFFDEMARRGWDAAAWCGAFCGMCSETGLQMSTAPVILGCGEEFRNCADIQVLPASPSPNPGLTPVQPTPRVPTLEPESESEEEEEGEEEEEEEYEEEEEEEEEVEEEEEECQAIPGFGQDYGATDARCTRACRKLPSGSWPCTPGDMCACGDPAPTQASTTQVATPTQAPTPPQAPAAPSPATTTGKDQVCLHQKNCDSSDWCRQDAYEEYCLSNGKLNHCPSPHCFWGFADEVTTTQATRRVCLHQKDCDVSPWCSSNGYEDWCQRNGAVDNCLAPYCYWGTAGGLIEEAHCSGDNCVVATAGATSTDVLLQLRSHQDHHAAVLVADDSEEPIPVHGCQMVAGNVVGATNAICALTCDALPQGWWPCGEGGPCTCTRDSPTTNIPTMPPPAQSPPVPAPAATPPAECSSCKARCQALCNGQFGGVEVNQCWGTPRYIQCTCKGGTSYSFDGCPCEHEACPPETAPLASTPPTQL